MRYSIYRHSKVAAGCPLIIIIIIIILYYAKWQHIHIIYNNVRRYMNYQIIIKPAETEIGKN